MSYKDKIKAFVDSSINVGACLDMGKVDFEKTHKGQFDTKAVWSEILKRKKIKK